MKYMLMMKRWYENTCFEENGCMRRSLGPTRIFFAFPTHYTL